MLWGGAELLEEPLLASKVFASSKRWQGSMLGLEQSLKYPSATRQSQVGHVGDERFLPVFCNIVVFPFLSHLASLLA